MPINLTTTKIISQRQKQKNKEERTCKTFDNFVRKELDLPLPQSPPPLYFLFSLVAFLDFRHKMKRLFGTTPGAAEFQMLCG
jgi:hypothetical protein